MTDKPDLKAVCEAATPGPWEATDGWYGDDDEGKTTVEASKPEVLADGQSSIWPDGIQKMQVACTEESHHPEADAAFIATFNPATVSKLLAVVEAARDADKDATIANRARVRAALANLDDGEWK